jgi:hypothetical protein
MPSLPPITDYASLQNAVIAMSDRSDAEYVQSIPLFIQQGETRLFRNLRCPANEAIATYLATAYPDNVHGIAIPNNYLEAKWVLYADIPLERISDQRYLALSQGAGVAPGRPCYFARVTDQLLFWPHADANEDVRVGYYEAQGPISESVPWVKMLRVAPFAYLYGALAEGARFTRDVALMQQWQQLLEGEIAELNDQALDNEISGSTISVTSGGSW